MSEQSSLLLIILFLCSSVKLPTQNAELATVSGIFLFLAGRHVSSCCIFGISNLNFFLVFWCFGEVECPLGVLDFSFFFYLRVWFCLFLMESGWSRIDSCVYVFSTNFFLCDFLSILSKLLLQSVFKLTSRLSALTGRPTNIRTARL